jgi:hypothetical protein
MPATMQSGRSMCALYNALAAMMSGETIPSQTPPPASPFAAAAVSATATSKEVGPTSVTAKSASSFACCSRTLDFVEERKQRIRVLAVGQECDARVWVAEGAGDDGHPLDDAHDVRRAGLAIETGVRQQEPAAAPFIEDERDVREPPTGARVQHRAHEDLRRHIELQQDVDRSSLPRNDRCAHGFRVIGRIARDADAVREVALRHSRQSEDLGRRQRQGCDGVDDLDRAGALAAHEPDRQTSCPERLDEWR